MMRHLVYLATGILAMGITGAAIWFSVVVMPSLPARASFWLLLVGLVGIARGIGKTIWSSFK